MKTVIGMFDDIAQAKNAALDLENAGIPHSDISFVASNASGEYAANNADVPYAPVEGHAVGHDATVGAEIGGVAGLILGLTGIMIPGLGWIAGAGWLMATVLGAATGAVIGGLVGALTHVGVTPEDAGYYTEGVRRGGTLLAVRAQDDAAQRVADILGNDGAVDIDQRAAEYRAEGYTPISDTGYVPPVTTVDTTPVATGTIINPPVTDTTLPVVQPENTIDVPVTTAPPVQTSLPAERLRVPLYPHSAPATTPAWNASNEVLQQRAEADAQRGADFTPDEAMSTQPHTRGEEIEEDITRRPINEGQVVTNPATGERIVTTPDR